MGFMTCKEEILDQEIHVNVDSRVPIAPIRICTLCQIAVGYTLQVEPK